MKKIDRRKFLAGTGTMLALPMFESLWPTKALAQGAAQTNLILIKFPYGCMRNTWAPIVSGQNYSLPAELSVLQPHKEDLIFATNLRNDVNTGGIHTSSFAAFLTGLAPVPNTISVGPSIDQLIARQLGITTAPGCMQITAAGQSSPDQAYASPYGNISWIDAKTPASAFNSPNAVFSRAFGNITQPPPGTTDPMATYRKNILDNVVGEIGALKPKLSAPDKEKLDQYLTGIDEVQRSIAKVPPPANAPVCGPFPANLNPDAYNVDTFTDTNLELIKLGLACGRMRIVTYVLDFEYNSHFPRSYHPTTHYTTNPAYPDIYRGIQRKWASKLGLFLDKLKSVRDATGQTLLDKSIIVFGSGIADAQQHNTTNLPIILAGRGGGLRPNRVVNGNDSQLSNLWVAIARRMGTPVTRIGRSTGDLTSI